MGLAAGASPRPTTHSLPALNGGGFEITLQRAVAEAVDQSVQTLALLAVGAFPVIEALVIGNILHGIDGADRITRHLIHRPVDGGNARHIAAVVADGLNRPFGGKAGGDRGHQDQHVLAGDHGLDVVPKDDLGVGVVFRLQNVDGLMLVDGPEAGLGQFLGDAGTQNSGAVQTQDGIHRGIIDKMRHQFIGAVLGFTQAGLLIGDVDVVIDVGMIGGEMASCDSQGNFAALNGQMGNFDHSFFLRTCF